MSEMRTKDEKSGTEETALRTQASTWVQQARALVVATQDDYELGGLMLRDLRTTRDKIEALFGPVVEAAHRAHKKAIAARKEVESPVVEAEGAIKRKLADYVDAVERERREAQRKAEAELRRQEEERRLAEAERLAAEGREAQAVRALEEPIEVPEVHIEKATPKIEGLAVRELWRGEVVDMLAFLVWVASSPDRVGLVTPVQSELNRLAARLREQANVPGFRAVRETQVSGRKW